MRGERSLYDVPRSNQIAGADALASVSLSRPYRMAVTAAVLIGNVADRACKHCRPLCWEWICSGFVCDTSDQLERGDVELSMCLIT